MTPELAALILKYMRLLTFGLMHAPEIQLELRALNDQIAAMVADNRNPTPDERAALQERMDRAHGALSVL
jgi:hypothetical protein